MEIGDADYQTMHIGRHCPGVYRSPHKGLTIEEECPCPTEECGHVARNKIDPDCPQHGREAMKTLRSGHLASDCQGLLQVSVTSG